MKISTKGRYGLRAMLDLAMHGDGRNVPLAAISERQDISGGYLESIFSMLKKAGLVTGEAGSGGGYVLRLPPDELTVEQILSALESDLSITDRSREAGDTSIRRFLNRAVWDKVDERVLAVFQKTTLSDLAEEFQKQQQAHDSSAL